MGNSELDKFEEELFGPSEKPAYAAKFAQPGKPDLSTQRILVVEDEKSIQTTLPTYLEMIIGFSEGSVTIVDNLEAAKAEIAAARGSDRPYTMVLTDNDYPISQGAGISPEQGLGFLKFLNDEGYDVAKTLMTAKPVPGITQAARDLGAEFTPKPFNETNLREALLRSLVTRDGKGSDVAPVL